MSQLNSDYQLIYGLAWTTIHPAGFASHQLSSNGEGITLCDLDQGIRVSHAYLEMAGAFLKAEVVPAEGQSVTEMPKDLTYALCASNYQNAYLAITSFLTSQITSCYNSRPAFRDSFKYTTLSDVLQKHLHGLPELLKAASDGLQIAQLFDKNPVLAQKANEVLKHNRHFLTHPNLDDFGKMIAVLTKIQWGFPQSVARDVIEFFFEETNTPIPNWLNGSSRLFSIPKIEVYDAVPATFEKPLNEQPSRYRSYSLSGDVSDFQYDNNNGAFTIGTDDCNVILKFSKAGTDTVHAYNYNCKSLRWVEDIQDLSNIQNPRSYDASSNTRTIGIGAILLWENCSGEFFATKMSDIQYPNLSFEYTHLDIKYEWM